MGQETMHSMALVFRRFVTCLSSTNKWNMHG